MPVSTIAITVELKPPRVGFAVYARSQCVILRLYCFGKDGSFGVPSACAYRSCATKPTLGLRESRAIVGSSSRGFTRIVSTPIARLLL